ncbi:MAG: CopG family transcriptional regulator [Candidatus Marinimicrobia bacterium]|nr:CopG family transcriptional regulator [Candidatus Neomarinimicrobiota bacterium]MBL7010809.1 CopG family transcriptional regulator [Candidatus Neomarinimicrobiota bacterium]MBL7031007.1 CopG family transcriptional regulator [Candidatus Neomarinimicrobiota bacterium]
MNRTQIYITPEEEKTLKKLSKTTGKSKSELIRGAIDQYLEADTQSDWKNKIMDSAGIWKGRKDLPDFDEIRRSLDRE